MTDVRTTARSRRTVAARAAVLDADRRGLRARRARPGRRDPGRGLQDRPARARSAPPSRPGCDLLGENRVQEAEAKVAEVPGRDAGTSSGRSSRTRPGGRSRCSTTIESVDSVELARRLDRLARRGAARAVATRCSSRSTSTATRRRRASRRRTVEAAIDRAARAAASRGPRPDDGRPAGGRPRGGARRRSRGLRELSERLRGRWPASARTCRWA